MSTSITNVPRRIWQVSRIILAYHSLCHVSPSDMRTGRPGGTGLKSTQSNGPDGSKHRRAGANCSKATFRVQNFQWLKFAVEEMVVWLASQDISWYQKLTVMSSNGPCASVSLDKCSTKYRIFLGVLWHLICPKFVFGQGSVPDPVGGAHDAPTVHRPSSGPGRGIPPPHSIALLTPTPSRSRRLWRLVPEFHFQKAGNLPTYQISFESEKLFVDWRTYLRTYGRTLRPTLLGRLVVGVKLITETDTQIVHASTTINNKSVSVELNWTCCMQHQ